jgi:hypothetical protein
VRASREWALATNSCWLAVPKCPHRVILCRSPALQECPLFAAIGDVQPISE